MIKHILTLVWNKKRNNVLMLLEIFVAFLILFAVFTFTIYYLRIYQSPLGFETEDTLLVNLQVDQEMDSLALLEMRQQLRREIESYPEVESMSFLSGITPFSGSMWSWGNDDNGFYMQTAIFPTDEYYQETARIEMLEGRWFEEGDYSGTYPPVIINQKLKETYYPDKSVVDSLFTLDGENKIVGVAKHFKYQDEFSEEIPLTFLLRPLHHEDLNSIQIKLFPNTPAEFEAKLNEGLARITKRRDFVILSLDARRERTSRLTWIPLIAGLSICGFLILNIALGLFGVLYYSINKRRAEIGLRRALGATKGEITSQFTLEVFIVAFAGMLLAAILAVQFPLLNIVEIPPNNFYWSILATMMLISLVVLGCAVTPSRQAAGIHPAQALHEE
ncbi:MAG: ABC transporter permease [Lewinella sp.]|uniref:ABC transporter permease n=1 Tax=Lewinella sp. TaxID=2004506 RepID=UPI003D6B83AD